MGPCWLWTGQVDHYGYARDSEQFNLHRRLYEVAVGPVPNSLVLDHLCGVRRCVNPEHLEPVTPVENIKRAAAQRTACRRGHPRIPENIYIGKRGTPTCRICWRASLKRWRERQKQK